MNQVNNITTIEGDQQQQQQSLEDSLLGQQQPQQQQQQSLEDSLLEKSNKLSSEDRQLVHEFFLNRELGLPPQQPVGVDEDTGIWKIKLNVEKTFDQGTGESVKETLYLELNYMDLGYKKTRKIKRK